MSRLAAGWASARLDEVAQVQLGRQRSPKNHSGERMRPYVRAANLTWNGLDLSHVKEMNFSEAESSTYELRPGDLLMSEASGSPDEVGKPAIWRGEIEGCCFQNTVVRVRSGGPLPEYLRYYLLGEARSGRIGRASPGVGIHHIGAARLSAWLVPVPPLAEQRRIVAAIEEQFSRLDAAESVLLKNLRRVESLRKTTLVSSIPKQPGEGWTMSTVGDAGTLQLGRQRAPRYHMGPNMRPYLRVANVFEGRIDVSDVKEMDFSPEEFRRYRLEDGDILLNEGQTPDLVGRPAIYNGQPEDVCFTNSLIRFRPHDGIDKNYALVVFRRHLHAGRFKREARITTNIAHLSAGRLKAVEFPYPPLAEQRRIVAELEQQLSLIESLRASIEKAQKRSAALRRAILEQAFRGELVPQDPQDEPASILLERIRAERAAAPAPTRRRRVSA